MTDSKVNFELESTVNNFVDLHAQKDFERLRYSVASSCVVKCVKSFEQNNLPGETECLNKCLLNYLENSYINNLK